MSILTKRWIIQLLQNLSSVIMVVSRKTLPLKQQVVWFTFNSLPYNYPGVNVAWSIFFLLLVLLFYYCYLLTQERGLYLFHSEKAVEPDHDRPRKLTNVHNLITSFHKDCTRQVIPHKFFNSVWTIYDAQVLYTPW